MGQVIVDMSVEIGGLRLKNPVLVASGTFGYGLEYKDHYEPSNLGGIVVKGISLEPQIGNPPPRLAETPCGLLNSIGLANVGVKDLVAKILPLLKEIDTHILVNIYGKTIQEYRKVAQALKDQERVSALEVNISCPNVEKGGLAFGADPTSAYQVIKAVKQVYPKTVIAKLTPNITDIVPVAKAVEEAGADAISLINTLRGMAVDIHTRRPKLATIFGGLSGPAIRPVALYFVYKVVKEVKIPVIGIGGIFSAEDALEFLIVGSKAVQIGTANFVRPKAPIQVIEGIKEYMERNSITRIVDLIGTLIEDERKA